MGRLSADTLTGIGREADVPGLSGLEAPGQTAPGEQTVPETVEPGQTVPEETVETEPTQVVAEETVSAAPVETVAETVAPTQPVAPAPGLPGGSAWLYAALALVAAVLVCLVIDTLRKGRKEPSGDSSPKKNTAPPPAQTCGDAAGIPGRPGAITAALVQGQGAREDQQDCCGWSDLEAYPQQGVLAVVADGMGGLSNGSVVSSALVRIFQDGFRHRGACVRPGELLLELASQANAQIGQMLRGAERSGSTLVSVIVQNGYLYFLSVGDSHLYLYRGGALLRLNREHVYQEELAVRAVNRTVPLSQVQHDRQAHSLTSYFGSGTISGLDRSDHGIKLVAGDRIFLATDGVFGTLSDAQMEQALELGAAKGAKTMDNQVREANRPYQDNYTGLILEYRG